MSSEPQSAPCPSCGAALSVDRMGAYCPVCKRGISERTEESSPLIAAVSHLSQENAKLRAENERLLRQTARQEETLDEAVIDFERLVAENAAMREIVEAVANAGATTYRDREDEYCTQDANCMWRSPGRGEPFQMVHTDRCIVTKARALLATGEE